MWPERMMQTCRHDRNAAGESSPKVVLAKANAARTNEHRSSVGAAGGIGNAACGDHPRGPSTPARNFRLATRREAPRMFRLQYGFNGGPFGRLEGGNAPPSAKSSRRVVPVVPPQPGNSPQLRVRSPGVPGSAQSTDLVTLPTQNSAGPREPPSPRVSERSRRSP